MKIMIGIPSPGFSRDDHFYDYINVMNKPVESPMMYVRGQSPARNRNIVIRKAIEIGCTHIFFVDDDVAVPQDCLDKLIENADLDIVTGLYLMRAFPHKPIIFDEAFDNGECKTHFLDEETPEGLIPIVNCGLGCVLIRIEVFKALEEPWIRLGECESDHWSDDIGFFNRARKAGFKLFADTRVQAGHLGQVCIKPVYKDGKWYTVYETFGDGGAMFPAVRPSKEQIEAERNKRLVGV